MIDYEKTKAWRSDPVRHTYTERDTILYALGVGFAADPLVLEELRLKAWVPAIRSWRVRSA